MSLRQTLKWWLYPGINLNARQRFRRFRDIFGRAREGEARWVLDAGCGNGMLSYRAYRRGNHVLGVSIKDREVSGCRRLFHEHLGLDRARLRFEPFNLYEVGSLEQRFDEIVCSEVIEHIRGDDVVCAGFARVLRAGGVLHLCAPNADHPLNQKEPLDLEEQGGHVRPGYTLETYRALLEPHGFEITEVRGLGGPIRQWWNKRITATQRRFGPMSGLPVFALSLPFLLLDAPEPEVPYSLYVRAEKRATPAEEVA